MFKVNYQIKNIVNHPEHAEVVADWIYNEFSKPNGVTDYDFVVERIKNRSLDKMPLSYIAIEKNKCMGVISLFENDLKPRMDLTPWLAGLYVVKDFRGRGIAEMLIDKIIEISKKLGYDKLYLRTEHKSEYYIKRNWKFLENTIDENGQDTTVFLKNIYKCIFNMFD